MRLRRAQQPLAVDKQAAACCHGCGNRTKPRTASRASDVTPAARGDPAAAAAAAASSCATSAAAVVRLALAQPVPLVSQHDWLAMSPVR